MIGLLIVLWIVLYSVRTICRQDVHAVLDLRKKSVYLRARARYVQ